VQIHVSVEVLLSLFIINVGLFSAGLLWFWPQNRPANRLLAGLMAAIALWQIDGFFRLSGLYRQNPNLYFLPIFYSLAFGPLIWFYVRSLTNSVFRLGPGDLWHFLPVAIQAALYGFLTVQPYAFRNSFWSNVHEPITYRIEFDGTLLSLLVYLGLSLRLLQHYGRYVEENFSETSRLTLRWLRVLLLLLVIVTGQWAVETVLRDGYGVFYRFDFSYVLLGLLLLVLGTAGLWQGNLPVQFADAKQPPALTPAKPTPDINPDHIDRIRRAMTTDKLYLNSTLTLTDLAQHVNLNPKVVSQVINTGIGQSFNDFVNHHRVEAVQQRLRTDDLTRLTLLGIALESGFNSKTTFNRIFKQHTGQSPSAFAGAM
jgi:AraC-like DNA-binding protein